MRWKTVFILLGVAAAGVAASQWLPSPPAPSAERRMEPTQRNEPAKPVPLAALPAREPLPKPAGQPFRAQSWEPPTPKVAAPQSIEPVRPPAPYRMAGTVTYAAAPEIVLVKGNRVVLAREGDTLEDGYKVDAVAPDHVTLVHLPSGAVERLPLASSRDAPASAAAGASPPPVVLPPLPPLPSLSGSVAR